MNKCIICGNLGKDPELTYTQTGNAVCKFSVAVNEKWTDSAGEKQEKTEWFNCVAWRGLAETCGKYLEKGRQVLIEGKIQTRSWEDDKGVTRYMTELVAREVQFLGGSGQGGNRGGGNSGGKQASQGGQNRGNQQQQRQQQQRQGTPPQQNGFDGGGFPDDDIPF